MSFKSPPEVGLKCGFEIVQVQMNSPHFKAVFSVNEGLNAVCLKSVIHGLKFSRFSKDWLNFNPCVGKDVVQKLIYCSSSVEPPCWIFPAWSVYSDGREVSLLSEYNSSVGRIPPFTLSGCSGASSNFWSSYGLPHWPPIFNTLSHWLGTKMQIRTSDFLSCILLLGQ